MGGGNAELVSPRASTQRAPLMFGRPASESPVLPHQDEDESSIVAPTPLYKLPYRREPPHISRPAGTAGKAAEAEGSEIETILAEKGKTGENVICLFPRITSCDDFGLRNGMLRVESACDMGAVGLSRHLQTASPVLRSRLPGDEVPSDFPIAVAGGKSYLDLSALDDGSSNAYGSSTMLDYLDESFVEPPTRSSNPLKSLLSSPCSGNKAPASENTRAHAWSPPQTHARPPFGAELQLNTLSPAFTAW